jgi:putative ABC transport system permease protein
MTLGASRGNVVGIVLRQTLLQLVPGIMAGVILSLAAARSAGSLLYGLQPTDVLTFIGASALLIAVALLASFMPAQRASRVSPMEALRCE